MRPRGRRILAGATLLLALSARPGTGQTWVADHAGEAIVGIEPLSDGGLLAVERPVPAFERGVVVRLDDKGDTLWRTTIGGRGTRLDAAIELDDGYLVAGAAVQAPLFAKIRFDGSVAWQRRLTGPSSLTIRALARTQDGGIAFAGHGAFGLDRGLVVGMLAPDASPEWLRLIPVGGSLLEYAYDLVATPDGGFLVSACGASTISAVDALLVQFERDGDVAWQRSAGGRVTDDLGREIAPTAGGWIWRVTSLDPDTGEHAGDVIARLDASGQVIWQLSIAGDPMAGVSAMAPAPDGGVIASGQFYDAGRWVEWWGHVTPDGALDWDHELVNPNAPFLLERAIPSGYFACGSGSRVMRLDDAATARTSCTRDQPFDVTPQPGALIEATSYFTPAAATPSWTDTALEVSVGTLAASWRCASTGCEPPREVSNVLAGKPPLRLYRTTPGVRVERVASATSYNAYIDVLGSWAPAAGGATICNIVTWLDLGDGTLRLDAEPPLGGWIVVTARGACGEGGAGRDSFFRERQDRPGWSPCP